jgi:hypothetical protein
MNDELHTCHEIICNMEKQIKELERKILSMKRADTDRRHEAEAENAEQDDEYLKDRYEMMREAAMDNAGSYENQNHIFNDDRG